MFARQLACANAEPPRKRARRRGYPAPVAPRAMRRAQSIRGVSGGAGKTGKIGSRARRPGQIRARGEGRNPPRTGSRVPGRTPVRKGRAGGARKRARGAHLLVVLVQIFVRVGHLSRHRLRLIVKDGFIPDDGQRLADVDGPSPERRTRHLRCAPSCSARDSPLCPNYRGGVSLPGRWHGDAMYLKDRSYYPSHSRHQRIESRRSKRVSTRPCVRGSALSAVGRQR